MFKQQVDERILETRRKVAGRGFYLLLWALMVILLYRQFYLGQEFSDYGDIFFVWMAASLYVTIAGTLSGLKLFDGKKYALIIVPLVIACSNLGVNIYKGTLQHIGQGVVIFLSSLIGSAAVFFVFLLLYRRWEKRNIAQ